MYPLDVTMPQARCCVAGGLEFGAGSILRALRTRSAATEPVASPVLSPPSMRIRPPPLGGPVCSCPGRYLATMPLPVDPQRDSPAVRAASLSAITFVSRTAWSCMS